MSNVTIILPTYNESGNIEALIRQLQDVFAGIKDHNCSVLVVDDNSPDGTAEIVEKLQKEYQNIHLLTGEKKGLGFAYVRGMEYAVKELEADILFEMDADFSHDPELIPEFLRKIDKGADFVIGSRYIEGGSIPQDWGLHRKIFSVLGNWVVRLGLMIPRIKEWTSGYRALKEKVFKEIKIGLDQYPGYTFQIASMHRVVRAGFEIEEIPMHFKNRQYGESKILPFAYITNILRYILLNSSFVRFGIVGFSGFVINLIGLELFYRLGLNPGLSASIGAEFAIISNFILNNFWSFSHKKISRGEGLRRKFLHFNTVAIGAVVMQGLIVGLGTHFFGAGTRIFFLLIAVIFFVIPYSYFMYNRFVWQN